MKKNFLICIIGGNYGLKTLLPAALGIKNVIIKAVAIKNIRTKKNISFYYSWKKMINECRPDLVLIAVPPKLQSTIVKFLIKNHQNSLFFHYAKK